MVSPLYSTHTAQGFDLLKISFSYDEYPRIPEKDKLATKSSTELINP
ncbi:MAG: hypothetical protein R2766_10145 [Saprospiraceae bacterium]